MTVQLTRDQVLTIVGHLRAMETSALSYVSKVIEVCEEYRHKNADLLTMLETQANVAMRLLRPRVLRVMAILYKGVAKPASLYVSTDALPAEGALLDETEATTAREQVMLASYHVLSLEVQMRRYFYLLHYLPQERVIELQHSHDSIQSLEASAATIVSMIG